jgi:hypothetical protein
MNQQLDTQEWPAIEFQGEFLPQSLSAIHILIYQPLSERTLDWIWKLPHCKEVWKSGEAAWCIASAAEITDHLLDHRDVIAAEIRDRLSADGFDEAATINEWLAALGRIRSLAESTDGDCRWIAGEPTESAEETRRRILAFLDKNQPSET